MIIPFWGTYWFRSSRCESGADQNFPQSPRLMRQKVRVEGCDWIFSWDCWIRAGGIRMNQKYISPLKDWTQHQISLMSDCKKSTFPAAWLILVWTLIIPFLGCCNSAFPGAGVMHLLCVRFFLFNVKEVTLSSHWSIKQTESERVKWFSQGHNTSLW